MYTLEPAGMEDLELCGQIIAEGRQFQREQGFVQWTEDYPNLDSVRRDIQSGSGYVFKVEGETAGYVSVDFSGEPAYDQIDGAWGADRPYAVIHRMAVRSKFQGAGLAGTAFAQIERLCLDKNVPYVRVNTDFPNQRMQHVLEKNHYVNRGVILFNGEKLAYDKLL